jgi:hypothetical protein
MSRIVIAACILFVFTGNVWATECQPGRQGGDSHWAWRLIDGRKCWYQGAVGMNKSLLHWPAAEDSRDNARDRPDRLKIEKALDFPEVRSVRSEILKGPPSMPQPTFEDRWKLLLR